MKITFHLFNLKYLDLSLNPLLGHKGFAKTPKGKTLRKKPLWEGPHETAIVNGLYNALYKEDSFSGLHKVPFL